MTRAIERVPASEKAPQPSKEDIGCPLTARLTDFQVIANYYCTWTGTFKWPDGTVGAWRSYPAGRPIEQKFREEVERLRASGEIWWESEKKGAPFYFKHEAGEEVVKIHIEKALRGEIKTHKKSWENRYGKLAGVSFVELKKRFPHLYGSPRVAPKQDNTETITEEAVSPWPVEQPTFDDLVGPADEEMRRIEEEERDREPLHQMSLDIADTTADGDQYIEIFVSDNGYAPERVSEPKITVKSGGEDLDLYKVYLEEIDEVAFLQPGPHKINGYPYNIIAE